MNIVIRPETPADYHAAGEINLLAFSRYGKLFVYEFMLVAALRHRKEYDPDLALVAEVDGRVVGHAFFSPFLVNFHGTVLKAVGLGPLAVHPAFQKQGVGGRLLEEGHKKAREKGYDFSFLTGHKTYYPRFGYRKEMFGTCMAAVRKNELPEPEEGISERPAAPGDIPGLMEMWKLWFTDTDLALLPGNSVLDWYGHQADIRASVVEKNGELLGYIRYNISKPEAVKYFLAGSKDAVTGLLGLIREKVEGREVETVQLPVHPEAQRTKEWLCVPWTPKVKLWEGAMIKVLNADCATIVNYCEEVGAGNRLPGELLWPVSFED